MSKRPSTTDHPPADDNNLSSESAGEQHDDDDPQIASVAKKPSVAKMPSVARMPMPTEFFSTGDMADYHHDDSFAIPSRKKAPFQSEDDESLVATTSNPSSAFKYDSSDELPILQVLTKKAPVKHSGQHHAQGKRKAASRKRSASSSKDSKSKKAKTADVDVKALNNVFKPSSVSPYVWTLPKVNPAKKSFTCCDLLMEDAFIDKSAALHHLLQDNYRPNLQEFYSVPLHLVYPRRFAKTTLLQFIEAVFSPVPELEDYPREQIKTKIASLEYGEELLSFGMRPVLYLDMQGVASVSLLEFEIFKRLKYAGLDQAAVNQLKTLSSSPVELVANGVEMLNQKFKVDYGVKTKTIVLIDEHDKLFRNTEIVEIAERKGDTQRVKEMKKTIAALMEIFVFGKQNKTGISLFVLCGLTRMVGVGLSNMNNLEDLSRQSQFHGLCGISAREFVKCCSGELNKYAKRFRRGGTTTLMALLKDVFIPKWDGFRFGVDRTVGFLDPDAADGALFSPMDVWEIVRALVERENDPSSKWMETMGAEFEFANFGNKYACSDENSDGFIDLAQNLEGGWVVRTLLVATMERKNYMLLSSHLQVKKVLFELGLLSVKRVGGNDEVLLGSPNWTVTENAMRVLVDKTEHLSTPQNLANDYLSDNEVGFGKIVSRAASALTNVFRATRQQVVREYPFQDYLFMQLFYRFPNCFDDDCSDYELYEESPVNKQDTEKKGRLHIGIALLYPGSQTKAFIIEVKLAKKEVKGAAQIAKAHEANIKEATTQVQSYEWKGADVDEVQRVVVSGVWRPSNAKRYCELDAVYRFVDP